MRVFLIVVTLVASGAQLQAQEGRGGGVVQTGASAPISQPHVTYRVEPQYTPQALDAKLEGVVLLAFTVSIDGTPTEISITRGLGMGLDEKAVECLKQWKFQPGMRYGEPRAMRAQVEIKFKLPNQ